MKNTNIEEATYSPEDNKLRFYATCRLDAEEYAEARAAGFRYAPKQELFYCPRWTTKSEDFLLTKVDFIGDEDQPRAERAADRAERFAMYRDKRRADAHGHADRLDGMGSTFGHQDQNRADKGARRSNSARSHALTNWDKAEYWTSRTRDVIGHALYMERVDVRKRRIKKIKTDLRRMTKHEDENAKTLKAFDNPKNADKKLAILGFCRVDNKFTLEKYPRDLPMSQYEGVMSVWSAADSGIITPEQGEEMVRIAYANSSAYRQRWINHYNLRINYESQMLGEQGEDVATVWKVGGSVMVRGERLTISKVNKNRDGDVSSFQSLEQSGHWCANIPADRASNYEAPTEETTKAAKAMQKKRSKLPPMINRPGKHEMTYGEFKANKRHDYAFYKTVEIAGEIYRIPHGNWKQGELTLTDKPIKDVVGEVVKS